MRAWPWTPFVCEDLPVCYPKTIMGEIHPSGTAPLPMPRLPEGSQDRGKTFFIGPSNHQGYDALFYIYASVIAIDSDNDPPLSVGKLGDFSVILAFYSRIGPYIDGRRTQLLDVFGECV